MLVGHVAAGFAAKRVAPATSLGTLVLAAMTADFLWCVFMIAGLDRVQFTTDFGAANYVKALDIAWSHSLATNAVWGAVFGGAYWLMRRDAVGARVLFALVLSHWLLDVIAHVRDMPIAPGIDTVFGLGLWKSVPATLIVEGGVWFAAILLYATETTSRSRAGIYMLWSVAALLTLAWYNNIAGPAPSDPRSVPFASLTFFALVVGWAYWLNRLRRVPARGTRALA